MAAKKRIKGRLPAAQIRKLWKEMESEFATERKQREAEGQNFVAITREQLETKLKRVNSPMIVSQNWSSSAPPGGAITYAVRVWNLDVFTFDNLALSISIGNRNAIASNDQFLNTFDQRFPTYAKPAPNGFTLWPAASTTFWFQLNIPLGIEKTGYFGNCVLQQISLLDTGKCLDRSCFFFDVV